MTAPRPGRAARLRVAVAIAALTLGTSGASAGESPLVQRGRYLANGIARCFWCHAPLTSDDPAVPVPETLGAGDVLDEKKPVIAPNITPHPDAGIGRWTDAEIARAIREGRGRDGALLRNDHPASYYSVMTDEDVAAVVAYLRSLPPVNRRRARSAPQGKRGETVQAPVAPARAADVQSRTARGAYLVQLGECRGCHTTTTREGTPFRAMEFGGGRRFGVANGVGYEVSPDPAFEPGSGDARGDVVASANLTADPSGIGYYDEAMFVQTLRTGRVGGVRRLSAAMPWVFFRTLTDDDLGAIFAYLRTLPPVRHDVSNTDPPTLCPRCGRRHGRGELNVAAAP